MMTTTQRPLPPDAIAGLASIAEVCEVLRAWGYAALADRLAYLASDADLEDGDLPARLESVRGFLAFFGAVESPDGQVDLGTTRDGLVSAHWRFSDKRSVSLYFLDEERIEYAARKSDGHFIGRHRKGAVASHQEIARHLVAMEQWFTWFKKLPSAARSQTRIT